MSTVIEQLASTLGIPASTSPTDGGKHVTRGFEIRGDFNNFIEQLRNAKITRILSVEREEMMDFDNAEMRTYIKVRGMFDE